MRLKNVPGSDEVIKSSQYVINDPQNHKGKWSKVFRNSNPIHIEVGMGKGRFISESAKLNPKINYIGIERYSSVLVRAVEKREDIDTNNLLYIRMDAELLPEIFAKDEVEKIYLNFSDPWPKDRHAKRRLTSTQFLERYKQILKKDGLLEFKSDNADLFQFSLEQVQLAEWVLLKHTFDLHNDVEMSKGNIMTEYEEKFSSKCNPIHKLIAKRNI